MRLIARELFWWLTGTKYKLRRMVEMGDLMNACSERGGRKIGQKRDLGSKKAKPYWNV
jgi:hypothetical protein